MMRVLHLGSFQGNIGDGASHAGFRACFSAAAGKAVKYINFEIRETYWGEKTFDLDFVEASNSSDLVVVGGGNFFELSIQKSRTGATFDVPPEVLKRIKVPIIFNSLGCDPYKGYTVDTISRFRRFLDYALSSSRVMVSVRNDGSLANVSRLFGDKYANRMFSVADCGFFSPPNSTLISQPIIAVNVAGDMLNLRFPESLDDGVKPLDQEMAMFELAQGLVSLTSDHPELQVVFVPHVFSDLEAISMVLRRLPDKLVRKRVKVASYQSELGGFQSALDIYQSSQVVIAMRFHATVCPLGFGRPVVCLTTYPKMFDLLKEIQREDIGVDLRRPDCGHAIASKAELAMQNHDSEYSRGLRLRESFWMQNLSFYRQALEK